MITAKELELFEEKIRDREFCTKQNSKILKEMIKCIRLSAKFVENDFDNWSDYGAWSGDNWNDCWTNG